MEFNISEGKPQWREVGADTWNFFSGGVDFEQLYSNTAVDAGTTTKSVSLSYTLTQDYDYILVSATGSAFRVIGEQSPSGFAIGSPYTVSISNSYTPIFQSGNIKVYKDVKSGTKITATNMSSQSSGVKIWVAVMMSIYTV